MPLGQRWALRVGCLLMLLLATGGTIKVMRSTAHESWQQIGILVMFAVSGPTFVRLVWVSTRTPPEQVQRVKMGWGEVVLEWGLIVVVAVLCLGLWLSLLAD